MRTLSTLDATAIVATSAALAQRVEERFPGSGLAAVAGELHRVAQSVQQRAVDIARPRIALRIVVAGVICLLVVILVAGPWYARIPSSFALPELVQVSEAALNLIVLIGGAVFFLVTVERRLQRQRVLAAIHELRALAHIIDMHQLSKDPQRVLEPKFVLTPSSPQTRFDAFALSRYLDYCGEMFSLTGKLAALYTVQLDDPVIVAAVNDIETLTTGLSRKVWQKIVLLHSRRSLADGA